MAFGGRYLCISVAVVVACLAPAWVSAAPATTRPAVGTSAGELGKALRQMQQHKAQQAKVAHIDISGSLPERPPEFSLFGGENVSTHYGLVRRLREAAADQSLSAVLVTVRGEGLELAQAQELRDLLAAISKTGKKVFVYADSYTTASYTLATGASDICLLPGGEIEIPGVAVEAMFARGLLDKVGVRADFIQIGEYKGAAEGFTRTSASPELRGEMNALVKSLYNQIVKGIADRRDLGTREVEALIDRAMIPADAAKDAKLVDHVLDIDGLRDLMASKLGKKVDLLSDYGKEKRDEVDFSSPFALMQLLAHKPKAVEGPAIGLVYVDGMIVSGEGEGGLFSESAASDGSIRKAMRVAMRDPNIKAVVIRIDSPGGSALASEAAWQAVHRVAKEKPVVISVGHMAASGGYYIASAGDRIFADPTAIVGSIGVVGGKMSLAGLYQKLGITTETFSVGANASIFGSGEGFTDGQRQMMTDLMKQTYNQFVDRVMTTRKGKIVNIDQVARGRIFVGEQAVALGLVDEIGGLQQALGYAAGKGGLGPDYNVRILPTPKTLADILSGPQAVSPVQAAQGSTASSPLMMLPRNARALVSYQMLAAHELEKRPVLLLPQAFVQIR